MTKVRAQWQIVFFNRFPILKDILSSAELHCGKNQNKLNSNRCHHQIITQLSLYLLVFQSRQQALRTYWPEIYTVCWACLLAILPPKLFSVYERSKGGHEKGSKKIIKVLHCCLLLFMCWCKLQKKTNWNNLVQKVLRLLNVFALGFLYFFILSRMKKGKALIGIEVYCHMNIF